MPRASRGPSWDQFHEKEFLNLVSHKRFRHIDGEHTAQMVKGYVTWDKFIVVTTSLCSRGLPHVHERPVDCTDSTW